MRRKALLSARPRPPPDPPVFLPVDPILRDVALYAPAWGSVGRAALDDALRGELAQAEREAREREEEARAAAEHLEKVKKAEQAVRAAKAAGVTFDAMTPRALRLRNETPEFRRLMIAASKNMTPEQYADLEQMAARASPEEKAMFGALIQPPPERKEGEEWDPWAIILAALAGGGIVWLIAQLLKPDPPAQAVASAQDAQAAATAPKYRPPYDIVQGGTLDDHMAQYGHLPVAPKPPRTPEPDRVGLDSATASPLGLAPYRVPGYETGEAPKKRKEQA